MSSTSGGFTHRVVVPSNNAMAALLGPSDSVLRAIETGFDRLDLHVRGNELTIHGPQVQVATATQLVDELIELIEAGVEINADVVRRSIEMLSDAAPSRPADVLALDIVSNRGRAVRPKTIGQRQYVDAIDANTVTFGIGPAGTGKTYLAVAKAVQAWQTKQVSRIVLTRPAVEAGENLGFLPGSLSDKIDPYLRPLYDAMRDMLDQDVLPRLIEAGTVEVAPLAYMRGRTLNDAFIILDEAQNCSMQQMKMFLTRLGFGSTMVVTGDVTQIDLPVGVTSGLRVIEDILVGVDDIAFCHLSSADVVRHRLVGDIIDAYGRWDVTHANQSTARTRRTQS